MWIVTLALRNLVRNLRRTIISGTAIALTVALMLVGSNFEYGTWQDRLEASIGAVSGHVVLQEKDYVGDPKMDRVVTESGQAAEALRRAMPEADVVRRVFVGGLLSSPRNSARVMVQGVEPSFEKPISRLDEVIEADDPAVAGRWLSDDDANHILIGRAIADQLQVELDDKVVLMTQVGDETESVPLRIRGIYDTGIDLTDGFTAIAPIGALQPMLPGEDPAHHVAVLLDDVSAVARTKARVAETVSRDGAVVLDWTEALPKLYQGMRADRDISAQVYGFIGVIVAIVILTTILMSVMERTREFGVLLALGMRPRHLILLILTESLFLGILATLAGIVIHAPFTAYLMFVGVDMGDLAGESVDVAGAVLDNTIRARVDWASLAIYAVGSVVLTVLAGVWPAWRATRLTPVDAMRSV